MGSGWLWKEALRLVTLQQSSSSPSRHEVGIPCQARAPSAFYLQNVFFSGKRRKILKLPIIFFSFREAAMLLRETRTAAFFSGLDFQYWRQSVRVSAANPSLRGIAVVVGVATCESFSAQFKLTIYSTSGMTCQVRGPLVSAAASKQKLSNLPRSFAQFKERESDLLLLTGCFSIQTVCAWKDTI